MAFDAGASVDALDWDFSTLKNTPEILKDARGTIPEPTSEQVNRFIEKYVRLGQLAIEGVDEKPAAPTKRSPATGKASGRPPKRTFAEKITELMDSPDTAAEDKHAATEAMIDLIMIVCLDADGHPLDGAPTREQVVALGARVREQFLVWLNNELMGPKEMATALNTLRPDTPVTTSIDG